VVKLFGDRYCGPESHAAESSAYQVLASHDLPVPRLVAAGDLFPRQPTWRWPFLVVTALPGRRYATLAARLDAAQRATIARSLGRLLCRLHNLPLPPASTPGPLASSWDRLLALLHRRRREVAGDHRRWGLLPTRLCDQLEGWLPDPDTLVDPSRPPVFVHGDLHDEHVFVDPASATLTGVIDFTDVYAGDPRYDLVALHFHTFRLDTTLLRACLDAYGWERDAANWPQVMLTFTLLHDFNMFRPTCSSTGSPPWTNSPTRSGVCPDSSPTHSATSNTDVAIPRRPDAVNSTANDYERSPAPGRGASNSAHVTATLAPTSASPTSTAGPAAACAW
jgi:hygromycin-B 7''-O-kinase